MAQLLKVLGADLPSMLLLQGQTYDTKFALHRLDAVSCQLELSCCIPHAAAKIVNNKYVCVLTD